MSIPAHRQAAAVPTPAHSFELTDGALVERPDSKAETAAPVAPSAAAPAAGATATKPSPAITSELTPPEAEAPAPDAPAPTTRRKGA